MQGWIVRRLAVGSIAWLGLFGYRDIPARKPTGFSILLRRPKEAAFRKSHIQYLTRDNCKLDGVELATNAPGAVSLYQPTAGTQLERLSSAVHQTQPSMSVRFSKSGTTEASDVTASGFS